MNAAFDIEMLRRLPVWAVGFGTALVATVLGVAGLTFSLSIMADKAERAIATAPALSTRAAAVDPDERILTIIDGLPASGDLAMAMGAFNQLRKRNDAFVDFSETGLYAATEGETFCGKAGLSATGPWTNFVAFRGPGDEVQLLMPTAASETPVCKAAIARMLASDPEPVNVSLIADMAVACSADDTLFWRAWVTRCRTLIVR